MEIEKVSLPFRKAPNVNDSCGFNAHPLQRGLVRYRGNNQIP